MLEHGLIVSCQAEGDSPFNNPPSIAAFARAAEMGGAVAVRINGIDNIRLVRETVRIPVIGMTQSEYVSGEVLITGTLEELEAVYSAGATMAALDGTTRTRPKGLTGTAMISEARKRFDAPLIADISTFDEGSEAIDAGADYVATTLAGFTAATVATATEEPEFRLVHELALNFPHRVIAEGRIWTPEQAAHMFHLGAHAVVVGTAITRPVEIVRRFVEFLR